MINESWSPLARMYRETHYKVLEGSPLRLYAELNAQHRYDTIPIELSAPPFPDQLAIERHSESRLARM